MKPSFEDRLESYFQDEMDELTQQQFLEEINQDMELKRLFLERKLIGQAFEAQQSSALRQKMNSWQENYEPPRLTWKRMMPIALAASVLGFIIFLMLPDSSGHTSVADFYRFEDNRGTSQSVFENAEAVILAKEASAYEAQLTLLKEVTEDDPQFGYSHYLSAHLYYLSKKYPEAEESFKIAMRLDSSLINPGEWNLALVYVSANKSNEAKAVLAKIKEDRGSRYRVKAADLYSIIQNK